MEDDDDEEYEFACLIFSSSLPRFIETSLNETVK